MKADILQVAFRSTTGRQNVSKIATGRARFILTPSFNASADEVEVQAEAEQNLISLQFKNGNEWSGTFTQLEELLFKAGAFKK